MSERERQLAIITEIKKHVGVSVSALADKFSVSANTIRRDLAKLEKEGIVKKIHGAAVLSDLKSYDLPFARREVTYEEEKEAIGIKAASLVKEGETIIIDAGTTCLAVASHIKDKKGLTVLTNSVAIATELNEIPEIVVILSGGVLKGITRSLIGPPAEDFFEMVEVDKLFLATGGISIEKNRLTNPNMHEKSVKQKMMAIAREIILVADSYKFGNPALYPFASLDDVDKIITDTSVSDSLRAQITELGPKVIIA